MAKKFSELERKMSPEQIAKSDEIFQQMLAEIDNEVVFEPDLVDWLRTQNSEIKSYVNDMVRGVMNVQKHAQSQALQTIKPLA